MNKRMIAAGVVAAMMAPLAQAGVEVYGAAYVSLDFNNNNDPAAGNEDSAISLTSYDSRLGFRGDEDLGNGLSALWQIEQQVDFDEGTAFSSQRNTFVGLVGGFGQVIAGKHDTPYKRATSRLDIFAESKGDFNAIIGSVDDGNKLFDRRASNTIIYTTPSINGFSAMLGYGMPDQRGDDDLPMTSRQSDRDLYSLNGSYSSGPLYVTAAYELLNTYQNNGDSAEAMKVGGSYAIGPTTLGAIFESADEGGTDNQRNAFLVSVAHKLDGFTLKGAIAMAGEKDSEADSGATHLALGVYRNFTKNTEVYAMYNLMSNDANANYDLTKLNSVTGQDASALSFGINHKFSSK
ncbi:MAG: porin [Pseudomonadota bacterium]